MKSNSQGAGNSYANGPSPLKDIWLRDLWSSQVSFWSLVEGEPVR